MPVEGPRGARRAQEDRRIGLLKVEVMVQVRVGGPTPAFERVVVWASQPEFEELLSAVASDASPAWRAKNAFLPASTIAKVFSVRWMG